MKKELNVKPVMILLVIRLTFTYLLIHQTACRRPVRLGVVMSRWLVNSSSSAISRNVL